MNKILSIDYGRKRIGLAQSDNNLSIAFPIQTITSQNSDKLFEILLDKLSSIKPDLILIGYPLGNDFKPTQMSIEVDEFIKKLSSFINIEIIKWNEVGTSKIAMQNLRSTKNRNIDSESARIILQEYLDFKK